MRILINGYLCSVLLIAVPALVAQGDQSALAQQIINATCGNESHVEIAQLLNLDVVVFSNVVANNNPIGWRATLTNQNDRFDLQRLATQAQFRGARLEWWRNDEPQLSLSVDSRCIIRAARRMIYDENRQASAVAHLDEQLNDADKRDLLNPPVPAGRAPQGVPVAMIDAGVNYTLPEIGERLARGHNEHILGYDYWDLDDRPFDANPARSPFFPQRHGTRTASILLREAPEATLVPYRYPRPDMSRMGDLVRDAVDKGIRIIGMPLGSNNADEWAAFAEAAHDAPEVLFIASAGNRGVDLDRAPTYPASLDLDNLIVVSSSDDTGNPAEGSNWGAVSVDLLVPAENRTALNFDGDTTKVSGSSYAVSRVAALAVRILAQHPDWTTAQLKKAVFDRALKNDFDQFVSVGYIPDPLAGTSSVEQLGHRRLDLDLPETRADLYLSLDIVLLEGSGWRESVVENMAGKLGEILFQCEIRLADVEIHHIRVPERLLDFDTATAHTLVTQANAQAPTVYLVRDTLRQPAFDGEAFGRENSKSWPWLTNTMWLTAGINKPAEALAHELFHVLSNSGEHVYDRQNLMHPRTQSGGWLLTAAQCLLARNNAKAYQILKIPGN